MQADIERARAAAPSPRDGVQVSASDYQRAGWALCAIPKGSKGPRAPDWGDHPLPPGATAPGLGLIHRRSHTCAVDLDNLPTAADWLAAHGVALDELMGAPDAVRIDSGRPGRGKLLYRLPRGVEWLPTLKLSGGALELRCASRTGGANVQDVLPPTVHPETGKPYRWAGAGDWRKLPELPPELLALWQAQAAPPQASPPLAPLRPSDPYAARAIERAAGAVLGAAEGGAMTP